MTRRRIVGAYLTEAGYECLRVLRSPGFFVPILILPVAFYLLLGVAMAGMREARSGPGNAFIFVSFAVYGILAPGLIGISSLLASDRGQGILEYKRALPMPFGSYVVSKLLMAVILSAVVVAMMAAFAATLGGVRLEGAQFLRIGGIMVLGVAPVSAVGLFIATWASATAASSISSTLMVAMAILAGLFYPLPGVLWTLRPIWPTYHLQQLGLAAAGEPVAGTGMVHVAVLATVTVVFAALAARRLARPA
jgi:ABC-2 type transport system permease protein